MRRDDEPDLPLAPHGRAPAIDVALPPCPRCSTPTPAATLNHYGSRCLSCYEAFCQKPTAEVPVGNRRSGGTRAWAHALKAREETGEPLTLAQRESWRAALRHQHTEDDDQ